jgi:hypothetical protein
MARHGTVLCFQRPVWGPATIDRLIGIYSEVMVDRTALSLMGTSAQLRMRNIFGGYACSTSEYETGRLCNAVPFISL